LGNDNKSSGVYEENQPQQTQKYIRAEYERFEKSIRPVAERRITEQERELAKQYKDNYNKEIIIVDEKENNGFIGGASLVDKNKIYIDIKNKSNEEIKSELEKLIPTQKNDALQSTQNESVDIVNQLAK